MTDRAFLILLSDKVAEKRSDIADLINEHVDYGTDPDWSWLEHRFITAQIPGTSFMVEYDTLTTIIDFLDKRLHGPQWTQCVNHQYTDGGVAPD